MVAMATKMETVILTFKSWNSISTYVIKSIYQKGILNIIIGRQIFSYCLQLKNALFLQSGRG